MLPSHLSLRPSPFARAAVVLLGLIAAVNPFLAAIRTWGSHPWLVTLFVMLAVVLAFLTIRDAQPRLVRELAREEDELVISVRATRWLLPASWKRVSGGWMKIRVPLEACRLEWVGRSLWLHAQGHADLVLSRGAQAEQVHTWLVGQGVPVAIGR